MLERDPLKITESCLKTYPDAIPLYDEDRRLVARALIAAHERITELERETEELTGDCEDYALLNWEVSRIKPLRERLEKAEALLAAATRGLQEAEDDTEKAEAEVTRLRGAIEKAPHAGDCDITVCTCRRDTPPPYLACNCWKAALPQPEPGKPDSEAGQDTAPR
jgi:hypothetical protein